MRTVVDLRVELFGLARMISGRARFEVAVPKDARPSEVVKAVADVCPELVGAVIAKDRIRLESSYTLNLNGTLFVGDDRLELKPGDAILVFSSQAGG